MLIKGILPMGEIFDKVEAHFSVVKITGFASTDMQSAM